MNLETSGAHSEFVECDVCGFRYGAEHTLADGSYECPLCELSACQGSYRNLSKAYNAICKRIERLQGWLDRVPEWAYFEDSWMCPVCHQSDIRGHADWCPKNADRNSIVEADDAG